MARSSVELIVDASKAINPLRKVERETRKVEKTFRDANGRLRDAKGRFVGVGNSAEKSSKQLNKFAGGLRNVIAAAAVLQATKFALFKTSELETQARSLQVLTGSLGNAQKIIEELQEFGRVTPFTSSELIETAKRLKAFGFETEKLVDVTKRLGDIAGATGADLGGIATAFGQIQAKGRLQGEELLQLQERGVDLQGTLRKEYGLTADEFQKALSKGQIGADAVNFALVKLTEQGGKYADGAIAQSDTLAGKFSTLEDGLGRLATTIGKTLEPAIKFVLESATQAINEITTLLGKGAEARNFGMNQKQLDEIDRRARETAEQIGKLRGYGLFDPRTALLQAQIGRDLMRSYGFETGQLQLPAETPKTTIKKPKLGGGTVPEGGGVSTAKQRVDMSQRLLELNRQLRQESEAGNDREVATLELMIRRQEIAESTLLTTERQNALEQALFEFRQKIFELDKPKPQKEVKAIEQEQGKLQKFIESGQQSLKDLEQVAINVSQGIGDAIANALTSGIQGLIDGSAKVKDVFANMLKSVGQILASEGAKMIATYIAIGIAKAFAGLSGGTKFGEMGNFETGTGLTGFASQPSTAVFNPSSLFGRANGGPVNAGRPYMVGERGPELFIPGSNGGIMRNEDMRSLMGRSPASAAAPQMNFSFETTNIGGTEYVSREQLEAAMATTRRQAANDGAKRGMNMTIDKMRNSPRTRSSIGLG